MELEHRALEASNALARIQVKLLECQVNPLCVSWLLKKKKKKNLTFNPVVDIFPEQFIDKYVTVDTEKWHAFSGHLL